jgi:hypothetical protein
MKSTIEFDLPEDEDAHLDAAQGAKWKRFANTLHARLAAQAATEKRVERQEAYNDIRRWLQEEMRTAGLTCYSSQQLRELSFAPAECVDGRAKCAPAEKGVHV